MFTDMHPWALSRPVQSIGSIDVNFYQCIPEGSDRASLAFLLCTLYFQHDDSVSPRRSVVSMSYVRRAAVVGRHILSFMWRCLISLENLTMMIHFIHSRHIAFYLLHLPLRPQPHSLKV